MDAYLAAAQIAEDHKGPLFRSLDRERRLTKRRLHRLEVLAMIKRRAWQASLPQTTCCHTFRVTGITTYLQNGGTIEHAQQIANHKSPRTTECMPELIRTVTHIPADTPEIIDYYKLVEVAESLNALVRSL